MLNNHIYYITNLTCYIAKKNSLFFCFLLKKEKKINEIWLFMKILFVNILMYKFYFKSVSTCY